MAITRTVNNDKQPNNKPTSPFLCTLFFSLSLSYYKNKILHKNRQQISRTMARPHYRICNLAMSIFIISERYF